MKQLVIVRSLLISYLCSLLTPNMAYALVGDIPPILTVQRPENLVEKTLKGTHEYTLDPWQEKQVEAFKSCTNLVSANFFIVNSDNYPLVLNIYTYTKKYSNFNTNEGSKTLWNSQTYPAELRITIPIGLGSSVFFKIFNVSDKKIHVKATAKCFPS